MVYKIWDSVYEIVQNKYKILIYFSFSKSVLGSRWHAPAYLFRPVMICVAIYIFYSAVKIGFEIWTPKPSPRSLRPWPRNDSPKIFAKQSAFRGRVSTPSAKRPKRWIRLKSIPAVESTALDVTGTRLIEKPTGWTCLHERDHLWAVTGKWKERQWKVRKRWAYRQ